MKRVRHIKTVVQHVFVIDDGETLIEHVEPANAIPAADWSTYSSERFPAEVKAWEKQLNSESSPLNRSQRRAKPKR